MSDHSRVPGRCDHCWGYADEISERGEVVLSSDNGSDIHLCASCLVPFVHGRESSEVKLGYVAALVSPWLADGMDHKDSDTTLLLLEALTAATGAVLASVRLHQWCEARRREREQEEGRR